MYCDKSIIISLVAMMFFIGWALASVTISGLPDKYGRKKIFLISCFCNLICVVIPMLLPGGRENHSMIYVIIVMQFFNGFR